MAKNLKFQLDIEYGCILPEEINFNKPVEVKNLHWDIFIVRSYFLYFRPKKGFKFTFSDYILEILN